MNFSLILLHLGGAVMLLLYAVQMVRIGVENAWGQQLRTMLGMAQTGNLRAAAGGIALAILLQSSTAVAMLACGFAASGMLSVSTGLGLMLGADLGSALVARILSFDLAWLVPVCLLLGGVMHLKISETRVREIGRIVMGIGFVLLSLNLVGQATGPLRDGQALTVFSDYLADDYVTAFLVGAVFTWVIHSSVASILMLATFAGHDLLSLEAVLPMVLGCNLGGGLIAFWLTRGMPETAQRIISGNLLFRCVGALLALAVSQIFGLSITALGAHPAAAVVNFHVAFNLALVIVSLPLVGIVARLASSAPSKDNTPQRGASALDPSVLGTPRLALASATRELLRMGELVERMTQPVMQLMEGGDPQSIEQTRQIDDLVNLTHTDIKLYLARLNRESLTDEEIRHSAELTGFAISLEHAGDIVAKQLLALADEKAEKNWRFSPEGWRELTKLHQHLLKNLHLALNVLISQDLVSARQLAGEKKHMRDLVQHTQSLHLRRLQQGNPESIQTSGMHLEIVRGLKEMNSLLVSLAYPLLSRSGDLLDCRLSTATDIYS